MGGRCAVPVLGIALVLAHPSIAGPHDEPSVRIWISPAGTASPASTIPPPVMLSPAEGGAPTVLVEGVDDESVSEIGLAVTRGIDLYYANDFDQAESILVEAWRALTKAREQHVIPAPLTRMCFVFRMLLDKLSGHDAEAASLAVEARPYLDARDLEEMDIPPDGLAYIVERLEGCETAPYSVSVTLPPSDPPCTLAVDGVGANAGSGTLTFGGGIHWMQAACGGDSGWAWKLAPDLDGKRMSPDPAAESRCSAASWPVIVCGELTDGVLSIGSTLLAWPWVKGFDLWMPSEKDGLKGLSRTGRIESADVAMGDLEWLWQPLEPGSSGLEGTRAGGKKGVGPFLPSIVMASTGLALAGTAAGLGAWSAGIGRDLHAIQDPWEREKEENLFRQGKNAAIAIGAIAGSFLVTSIIYYAIVHHKDKKVKGTSKIESSLNHKWVDIYGGVGYTFDIIGLGVF